jgi:toxin ParE1/3/4
MKPLKLWMSRAAIKDLEDIWVYTQKNWSERQADRYYRLIMEEINHICADPSSGRSYEFVRAGYRASKVKSHLIFYRCNDSVLEVIRILHERMDSNQQFTP